MKKVFLTRFFEILPGALTWSAITLPIIFSFIAPIPVIIFILLFDLYWVYKSIIMGLHLFSGYQKMKKQLSIDWSKKLAELPRQNLLHAVIFTTYKESIDIVEPSVKSIVNAHTPGDRIILVLATEDRDKENAEILIKHLKNKYQKHFFDFIVTSHKLALGEMAGKGANATWAAKILSRKIYAKKLKPEQVIVTTADADTRFHKNYFNCLAYYFITASDRTRCSFQPIPIYSNNIWHATVIARILAFGSSFWQMIESTRPWRLINFSTHSMCLKTLEDMDYWNCQVVNEDSRQFWRAYYRLGGHHRVVPLFLPVYMDAVIGKNIKDTIKNQYQQRLRWAYGIEHAPFILSQTFTRNNIRFWDKFTKAFRFLENNFSWATASIFIAIVGWLPLLMSPDVNQTILVFNVRVYATRLLGFAWVGLMVSAIISMKLLPPRPKNFHPIKSFYMFAQWVLIPIVAILFSSIPAIDAQTRLMLGRYMGFRVTDKRQVES